MTGKLRAIATLGDQSHRTAKAIACVRTNYAKPLRVEKLAQLAGMGVSTLQNHFFGVNGPTILPARTVTLPDNVSLRSSASRT
jgi:transcriptional regulator GlxA family with amidase domain